MKYYSLNNILEKKAVYNVIFGERSNGKTYSVLEYCIKNYFNTGKQFAVVRRWKEDVTGRRASELFSALNSNNVVSKYSDTYSGVTYYAGKFYACSYDDNGKPMYTLDDCIGYAFALSDTEHDKGNSYPNVTTIMFDEFLTKHLYLQDEFVLFMNCVSTIVRNRTDVKVFMLGNTVNKFCPYFEEMGLKHILKMEQGSIDVYTYGDSRLTVAVEYCTSLKDSKSSNFYFAFDNPKLHMITGGAWELGIYPHLPEKYKPNQIKKIFFIVFNGQVFQCEIVKATRDYFIYIHVKTGELRVNRNDLVYTLDYHHELNYNRNILKPTTVLGESIKWFFVTDRVFYQNNDVGNTIHNYLQICRG